MVQFGPFAMAVDRLLALAAVWLFVALIPWLLGRRVDNRTSVAWLALGVGLVISRATYVVVHWQAFRQEPATIFAVWQGGFSPIAGIATALVVLAVGLKGKEVKLKALGATGTIAALWAVLTLGLSADEMSPFPAGMVAQDLGGQSVNLDEFRGKPFVLNFWATWCPPCQREMPMLASVAAEHPEPAIFFINQGQDAATVQSYLQEKKLSLPNMLLDRSGSIAAGLGARGLPTTIFVNSNGEIQRSHFGEISRAGLQEGLELIKNKD